jgi:serine/threonine protein kinase/Tfp pilus assembly protein PilF
MTDSNADRDPIDLLAESFVGRLRAGQRPSIAEYAERYPDLAGDLQELLPALVELEQNASADSQGGSGILRATAPPQQLGEYTIVREIGRGGMGVVYEAVQESLGRHVALKVLQVGAVGGARLERFRREAKAAACLHHTNIVPVYGIEEHAGVHYYAMQFIQGQSLNLVIDELKRLRNRGAFFHRPSKKKRSRTELHGNSSESARLHEDESVVANDYAAARSSEFSAPTSADAFYRSVAQVGLQVAEALAYAHSQGILHRDIKPSNLLLDGRGTVWVTDFGLAKSDRTDDLTDAGDVVGTLHYMAPERLDGRSEPRSDVYALGVTLYELVALEPLYHARARARLIEQILYEEQLPLRRLDGRIPRDLETIIEKALVKEPSQRYASAQQMADDLRSFLADRTIRARRTTTAERLWRWRRRNPALAGVSGALALVMALGFAGVVWKWRDAEVARQAEQIAREEADRRADEIRQGHERLLEAGRLVDLGTHFAEWGHWDDAAKAYSLAIAVRPELASAWEKRGDLYFHIGLFDLAAADFQRAFALHEPIFHWQWLRLALLQLHVGDTAGYRQVCDLMTKRIFGIGNPYELDSLIRTRLLSRVPDSDARRWITLAGKAKAADNRALSDYVLAIAHLRAGQYEQSIAHCQKEIDGPHAHEIAHVILAMAYQRLGQSELARSMFAIAAKERSERIESSNAKTMDQWILHQGATGEWPNWPTGLLAWLEFELYFRESAELLGLPLPSDDVHLHVLRSRAFAGLRERERADEEYQRALRLKGDDEQIRYEADRNRAYRLVELERFAEAADCFAQALAHTPGDCILWCCLATAQFAAGDSVAYRRTCASMFDRFAADSDLRALYNLTWACTLLPDALPDMQALAPVAQTAAEWWIDSERGLLATYYRLGQYEDAIQSFDRLTQVARPEPSALLFAAMAHHRLHQSEKARQKLAEAAEAMAEPFKHATIRMPVPGFDPRSWLEKVSERLLRKEAEDLILGDPSKTVPPSQHVFE